MIPGLMGMVRMMGGDGGGETLVKPSFSGWYFQPRRNGVLEISPFGEAPEGPKARGFPSSILRTC
jgi:hypothetical protein